jgi:hypothetical protein
MRHQTSEAFAYIEREYKRHVVAQLHMIEADPTDTARADERRR